jgi:hypothetical protein
MFKSKGSLDSTLRSLNTDLAVVRKGLTELQLSSPDLDDKKKKIMYSAGDISSQYLFKNKGSLPEEISNMFHNIVHEKPENIDKIISETRALCTAVKNYSALHGVASTYANQNTKEINIKTGILAGGLLLSAGLGGYVLSNSNSNLDKIDTLTSKVSTVENSLTENTDSLTQRIDDMNRHKCRQGTEIGGINDKGNVVCYGVTINDGALTTNMTIDGVTNTYASEDIIANLSNHFLLSDTNCGFVNAVESKLASGLGSKQSSDLIQAIYSVQDKYCSK